MTRNTYNKEKCNGRHPGCVVDIKEKLPVICMRFSLYGGDGRKFKPVTKNGQCISYQPDKKLINALKNENT